MNFRTIEVSDPKYERDALREVTFKSPALHLRADLTLFTPQNPQAIVLLLHGVYGSHWAWTRKGGAHHVARDLIIADRIPPMVLAMPSDGLWGDGSGYIRHPSQDFERYIVEEVPAVVAQVIPDVSANTPLFICGLSMGGFAALRLASKFPDHFAGISAHSAMTHFSQMQQFIEEPLTAYGPIIQHEQSALHFILTNRNLLSPLRFDCGLNDSLLPHNRTLHNELARHEIPHRYQEFPGQHDWQYWHDHLADSLLFFAEILDKGRS
jgi:putative tributyrin esterase